MDGTTTRGHRHAAPGTARTRIPRVLVAAALLAALTAGCGDDGGEDEADAGAGAGATTEQAGGGDDAGGGDGTTDDGSDSGSGGGDVPDGCPAETLLTVVHETPNDGDEEIVPADTAFPSAHFTIDLDGSGFGPELSGVLSTDPEEDVEALTHTNPDQPSEGTTRVLVDLQGPAAGETEFPLGVYDVTFSEGLVETTEGTGLARLDVQDGEANRQASHFTELEITHIGDGVICGEMVPVDRSDETSQAPTHVEGAFIAEYSERP